MCLDERLKRKVVEGCIQFQVLFGQQDSRDHNHNLTIANQACDQAGEVAIGGTCEAAPCSLKGLKAFACVSFPY
jgi:hypothetical protein